MIMYLRIFFIFSISWLCVLTSLQAQKEKQPLTNNHVQEIEHIKNIEKRIKQGDKQALYDITPFFDNQTSTIEYLGHHRLTTTISLIAQRSVRENSLYTSNEINIQITTSAKDWRVFLEKNHHQIHFVPQINKWLITPLEKRNIKFSVRKLSTKRKKEIAYLKEELKNRVWLKERDIDSLLQNRNPKVLIEIARLNYTNPTRESLFRYNQKELINTLQYLIGGELGVQKEDNTTFWLLNKGYQPDLAWYYLVFFTKNIDQFMWSSDKLVFEHSRIEVQKVDTITLLFEKLDHPIDSLAIQAFVQLTEETPKKVGIIAAQYRAAGMDKSYAIPIFPYKFLKQLSLLTTYCRQHQIDYKENVKVYHWVLQLKEPLTFNKRRQLENRIIETMTLDEVTMFEYWALVHEQSWEVTYSAGRILDMFYSHQWNTLVNSTKHLSLYLKKSALYERLGIIGICNMYLKKFINSSLEQNEKVQQLITTDQDINEQKEKIKKKYTLSEKRNEKVSKKWVGNDHYKIKQVKRKIEAVLQEVKDSAKAEQELVTIISKISYHQIGEALKAIENYPFQSKWNKYSFLTSDFGFFMIGDMKDKNNRDAFQRLYHQKSEYEMYTYYLDSAEVDYKKSDQTLDYDKIYQHLKYNVVVAFTGGGGGRQENEVYSLIKLLELTFKTTLSFPDKLCHSNGVWGCDSQKRTMAWRRYLQKKKLLKSPDQDPVSFHEGT